MKFSETAICSLWCPGESGEEPEVGEATVSWWCLRPAGRVGQPQREPALRKVWDPCGLHPPFLQDPCWKHHSWLLCSAPKFDQSLSPSYCHQQSCLLEYSLLSSAFPQFFIWEAQTEYQLGQVVLCSARMSAGRGGACSAFRDLTT